MSFRDYLPTQDEIAALLDRVFDGMQIDPPAQYVFEDNIIARTYFSGGGKIRMPARKFAEKFQVFHVGSCYIALTLHEAAHWIMFKKDYARGHTTEFYGLLFGLCSLYGPKDREEREAFMTRAFADEYHYIKAATIRGWKLYWDGFEDHSFADKIVVEPSGEIAVSG